MKIENGSQVAIHYVLKNDAGEVVDSSEGKEPLAYTAGAQQIIPGLDEALLTKTAGEHVDVIIEAADAYGERIQEAVQQIPKEQFKDIPELAVGMALQAETQNGPVPVLVTEIGDDVVTIDHNHPLAGQRLHFSVDVVSVDESEQDEPKIIMPN